MSVLSLLSKLNVPLGKWLGTEVFLHWTMTLALVLIGFLNWHYLPLLACLFLIVLLHEFGHVLAGKYVGIFASTIWLTPIGGLAVFPATKPSARDEFIVTIGGPLVNVFLIVPLWALAVVAASPFFALVAKLNILILVFNLVPAFPMDGGRILRSVLHYYWRDYLKATYTSVHVSRVCCMLMGLVGLLTMNFTLVVIALFLFVNADSELGHAQNKVDYYENVPDGSASEEVVRSADALRSLRKRLLTLKKRQ